MIVERVTLHCAGAPIIIVLQVCNTWPAQESIAVCYVQLLWR